MSQDIECPTCDAHGCVECNFTGWRPMTADEEADAAEAAEQERIHGEPPVTMAEQHQRDWQQKQELRS